MSFLNHIKVELFFFLIIFLNILISNKVDNGIYSFLFDSIYGSNNIYFKEFFVNITELGDSVWYFGLSFIFLLIFILNKYFNIIIIKESKTIINFFISFIIYLIIVGLLTQIIKHLVGRPRPNYANDFDGLFFLNLDSSFHSFPSGHSSTIFMVCLIMCAILPKLKYYFFAIASVIALSRVFVGAHFISDVVSGGLLSLIVFKILNNIISKINKNYLFKKINFGESENLYYAIIFLFISSILLTIGHGMDLYVASLFYLGNSQFILQSFDFVSILFRDILIPVILIYILFLPIVSKYIKIEKIFFNYNFRTSEIVLVWISQIFSILIIVNLLLKNLWGRSRPGDIIQFEGNDLFTPWYKITDSCQTNCSFVSGDASVGFGIITLYFVTKNNIYLYSSLIFGFLLGFTRIVAGGHFLSDVIFSGIVMVLSNLIIFLIYRKYYGQ